LLKKAHHTAEVIEERVRQVILRADQACVPRPPHHGSF
jgi:hypothetical protein